MPEADARGRVAVLLIAHGSRHAPANDDLHQLAGRFAARDDYPIVEACFLELAEPDIPDGGARCVARGATRVLMIPYFLSAGVHLIRDLTAARDALKARHPFVEFRLGPALGPDPLLEDLVVRSASASSTPRTPPRRSPHPPSWPSVTPRWAGATRGEGAPTPRRPSGRLDTIGASD